MKSCVVAKVVNMFVVMDLTNNLTDSLKYCVVANALLRCATLNSQSKQATLSTPLASKGNKT